MIKLKIICLVFLLAFMCSCNGKKDTCDAEIEKLEDEIEQLNEKAEKREGDLKEYLRVIDSLNRSNADLPQALDTGSINSESSEIRPNVYYQDGSYLFWGAQSLYIHGIIKLKGYFLKIPENGNVNGQAICDGFVITSGPKDYIDNLLEWVNSGNVANSKNKQDQIITGIDLTDVSESEAQTIKESTKSQQIELLILDEPTQGMVVGCFHSVKILDVN